MLSIAQERPRIRRELSRRIGYTNGLHDIFRFARVVDYLHRIAPSSVAALRVAIMENEKVRGTKYAEGVIDTARALSLIRKTGTKLTPSDKGYALHAVQQLHNPVELSKALLLNAILESDGEATLNILDLLAKKVDQESLGPMLVDRLLRIIDIREQWAEQRIPVKPVRDIILQDLTDSRVRLTQAVDLDRKQTRPWSTLREERSLSAEQKVQRFYAHTIDPRKGWLKDLGCTKQQGRQQHEITAAGRRLLRTFREASHYVDSVFVLPFSADVAQIFTLPEDARADDQYWRATAAFFQDQIRQAHFSTVEHFALIRCVYPHIKLPLFNEATTESLHAVVSAQLAVQGQFIGLSSYDEHISDLTREFSDEIYRMRQRYGRSGYISLKTLTAKVNDGRQ